MNEHDDLRKAAARLDPLGILLEQARQGDTEALRELYRRACDELAAGSTHTIRITREGELSDPNARLPVTVTFKDRRLLDWLMVELLRRADELPGKVGRPSTESANLEIAQDVARRDIRGRCKLAAAILEVAQARNLLEGTVKNIYYKHKDAAEAFIALEIECDSLGKKRE